MPTHQDRSTIADRHPCGVTRRVVALALAAAAAGPIAARAAEVGHSAPPFELPGQRGTVSLEALRGKVVLLDFWASWCAPCRHSFPWMNDMHARHGAAGLQIVAVNVDRTRADADAFLHQLPARFTVAFDERGDVPRRYAVKGMPTSVLIGTDGRVLRQHVGFRDDDKPVLEAAIVDALRHVSR
jgi:thiol-disulfide isomerase/thioredoxin